MGDPKRRRKKYSKPSHPWNKERIDEERILKKEYGLNKKNEIWKSASMLRKFKNQAKRLTTLSTKQAEIEKEQLIKKLTNLGLLEKGAGLENVLGIELKDILERRLQTLVLRKKLARTAHQARQFITHRHIAVADKVIEVPSYVVSVEEEKNISFRPTSGLSKEDHPERA